MVPPALPLGLPLETSARTSSGHFRCASIDLAPNDQEPAGPGAIFGRRCSVDIFKNTENAGDGGPKGLPLLPRRPSVWAVRQALRQILKAMSPGRPSAASSQSSLSSDSQSTRSTAPREGPTSDCSAACAVATHSRTSGGRSGAGLCSVAGHDFRGSNRPCGGWRFQILIWSDERHLLDRLPQSRNAVGIELGYGVHGIVVRKRTRSPGSHCALPLLGSTLSGGDPRKARSSPFWNLDDRDDSPLSKGEGWVRSCGTRWQGGPLLENRLGR
jgi:hypothetical protein